MKFCKSVFFTVKFSETSVNLKKKTEISEHFLTFGFTYYQYFISHKIFSHLRLFPKFKDFTYGFLVIFQINFICVKYKHFQAIFLNHSI